jgi:hypothetical protein
MNSWDYVSLVDNVVLAAGTGMYSEASLFLNGRHQTPVTVVVHFAMDSSAPPVPAPSDDEVRAALIWINYASGADIAQDIATTTQDDYCLYYNPSSSQ